MARGHWQADSNLSYLIVAKTSIAKNLILTEQAPFHTAAFDRQQGVCSVFSSMSVQSGCPWPYPDVFGR